MIGPMPWGDSPFLTWRVCMAGDRLKRKGGMGALMPWGGQTLEGKKDDLVPF
jgi:hypothetical protein